MISQNKTQTYFLKSVVIFVVLCVLSDPFFLNQIGHNAHKGDTTDTKVLTSG
jgi:hypothetical protein